MKRKFTFLLSLLTALFLFPDSSQAQTQEGELLGNWQDPSLPDMFYGKYNEVWGIVVNGVEYGVIGSTMGTHFISLEADADGNLPEVAFVAGAAQGSSIIHRDFHSYQNYMYAVADEGSTSTLQIIDFSDLPNSVSLVYDNNEFIERAHNIFIDEANARLYSTNGAVLSLDDPEQPVELLNTNQISGHDIFVRDNIVFINRGGSGLRVMDFTDVTNPVIIGSMTSYPNSGYNHAGWMSDDGQHYFLCDETGGAFVKSVSIDDITEMEVVDMFKAENENDNHIAHNAIVRGDILYVSYYSDGLQVFDISDPEDVVLKCFYDTYPGINDSGFKGAWGVYPLLPSGRVLISDMSTGLYLLGVADPLALMIPADGSIDVDFTPTLGWEDNTDYESTIEIAEDSDFLNIVITESLGTTNSYTVTDYLYEGSTYYWRIKGKNECGFSTSETFSFTTSAGVNTNDILAQAIRIAPNPVQDKLMVQTGDYLQGDLSIDLLDINGKLIRNWDRNHAGSQFSLTAPSGLQGVYLLRIANAEGVVAKRVLFGER